MKMRPVPGRIFITLLGELLPREVPPEEGVPEASQPLWNPDLLRAGPFTWNPNTSDAYGGWTLAPLDAARLYAALGRDAYVAPNLMSVYQRDYMWTPYIVGSEPYVAYTAGGWGPPTWVGFSGGGVGGGSYAVHNVTDGVTIAFAFNCDTFQSIDPSSNWGVINPWPSGNIISLVYNAFAKGALTGANLWPLAGIGAPL